MITIRYADLPEGLHARAESRGRRTIIYLRPGLTPEQRRESLRRARQSGRMGHGPRLPASGVAFAVARLTCRTTVRNAAAAGRRHPLTSALLLAVLSAAVVCYLLFVTVSIRFVVSPGWALSPLARCRGRCTRARAAETMPAAGRAARPAVPGRDRCPVATPGRRAGLLVPPGVPALTRHRAPARPRPLGRRVPASPSRARRPVPASCACLTFACDRNAVDSRAWPAS
jgi:hypothetical protein